MQEVEVSPRDCFIHYLYVTQGKNISWSFSTKKKNISFGLFQKTIPTPINSNILTAPNNSTTGSSSETLLSPLSLHRSSPPPPPPPPPPSGKSGRTSLHSLTSAVSRASFDTLDIEENEEEQGSSQIGLLLPDHSTTSINSQNSSARNSRKKLTSPQLKDPDLKELLPIKHYNSASATIKGSYQVEEEGTYCLYFDNSFSRNTSKLITFCVVLKDGPNDEEPQCQPEISGWLLKKKRKKMQGWAKRWFQISNGVMSYYQYPEAPCRGTIHIGLSAVSSSQSSRSINMDSGTATYQLKALTNEDFDSWIAVIRKYVQQSKERQLTDPDYTNTLTSPRQSMDLSRRSSVYKRQSLIRGDSLNLFRLGRVENDDELNKIYAAFSNMDHGFRTVQEYLELLKTATTEPPPSPNPQPRLNLNQDGKFRLKKFPISLQKANSIPTLQPETNPTLSPNFFSMTYEQIYEKLYASFNSLKADKEKALEILRTEAEKWKRMDAAYRSLLSEKENARKESLSSKQSNEKIQVNLAQNTELNENSMAIETHDEIIDRAESLTSLGTASEVFFDAEDIILGPNSVSDGDSDADADAANIQVIDEESEEEIVKVTDFTEEIEIPSPTLEDHALTRTISFRRRKQLPSPICGDDISLLSILRKNVGKDLATIAMPISLNEPLNLLQRMAEELEYSDLLDKAAETDSSLKRLMYVSAFAISAYASTQHRAGRKPFNPLHGETYEYVRSDKGFKFIAEKVSHYPPIMACHADSPNWTFWQDSKIKTKFWGKSMELIPSGTVHVIIQKYDDHFTFNKLSTWMRNMISANKYLEHTGVMRVQNQSNGEACEITFNQSGFFSSGPQNEIVGKLLSANGKKAGNLNGRWNESIFHEIGPNQLEVIWKANPPIPDYEEYYGFTQFAVELNEITPDIVEFLPNTDTRFRPDQRLFEQGKVEEAEKEKLRIEQKQRDFRKQLEKNGEEWEPQWFKLVNGEWVYKGEYFEKRDKKAFEKKIELW
ncbi:hypothetical protein G9A89_015709 [Geosiphon pyriformis]|nr:hypothetical protein G9A89_015709 [Geosiphon pyriformis]